MKALVINKPGELQVKDLPRPAISPDEVLVRMRAVGICHSDYELYSGKYIIPMSRSRFRTTVLAIVAGCAGRNGSLRP